MGFVAGSVKGNKPSQRVVIDARSVVWWIQPFTVHRFQNFTCDDGLSSNTVDDIAEGKDGAVWLATLNGLDEHRAGRWKTFLTSHGLPSSDVRTIFEDTMGVL